MIFIDFSRTIQRLFYQHIQHRIMSFSKCKVQHKDYGINRYWIDISNSGKLKDGFVWYVTAKKNCTNRKSEAELKEYAKEMENSRTYALIPSEDAKEINCQSFAVKMLAYAAGIEEDEAVWEIFRAVGNVFV